MKLLAWTIVIWGLCLAPAFAEKPEWAGKGKPTAEQKAAHKAAMNAKDETDDDEGERLKEKKAKKENKLKKEKGDRENDDSIKPELEGKKAEQLRKEADRGSEKAQQQRQEKSRKWWRFWEEDEG